MLIKLDDDVKNQQFAKCFSNVSYSFQTGRRKVWIYIMKDGTKIDKHFESIKQSWCSLQIYERLLQHMYNFVFIFSTNFLKIVNDILKLKQFLAVWCIKKFTLIKVDWYF